MTYVLRQLTEIILSPAEMNKWQYVTYAAVIFTAGLGYHVLSQPHEHAGERVRTLSLTYTWTEGFIYISILNVVLTMAWPF